MRLNKTFKSCQIVSSVLVIFLLIPLDQAQARRIAILVNGGSTAYENTVDSYEDIELMDKRLQGWDRYILSADGPSQLPSPLRRPNSLKVQDNETVFDSNGFPALTRKDPKVSGDFWGAATRKNIEKVLKDQVKEGDTVFLYFTDHGDRGAKKGESKIALWGEDLATSELKEIIDTRIPRSAKVILHNEACFGGAMLNSLVQKDGSPRPNSCGFAVASEPEFAKSQNSLAKSLRKSEVSKPLDESSGFGEIFNQLRTFSTASTGVSLSDHFCEKYLERNSTTHPSSAHRVSRSCKIDTYSLIPSLGIPERNEIGPILFADELQRARELRHGGCGYLIELAEQTLTSESALSSALELVQRKIIKEETLTTEDEVRKLKPLYKAAFDLWMKNEKNPSLYKKFEELNQKNEENGGRLLEIETRFRDEKAKLTSKTPKDLAQLDKKLAKMRDEASRPNKDFKKTQDQYNLYLRALKAENPTYVSEFTAFCEKEGGPDKPFPKNIVSQFNSAKTKIVKGRGLLHSCKTLQHSLIRLKALRIILDTNDQKALKEYLDLQDCENTPFTAPKTPVSSPVQSLRSLPKRP